MAGIGPFIPHPETLLREASSGSTELTKLVPVSLNQGNSIGLHPAVSVQDKNTVSLFHIVLRPVTADKDSTALLREASSGSTELTKRAVALARLLLPEANLPATTSLGVLDSDEKRSVFDCGANPYPPTAPSSWLTSSAV